MILRVICLQEKIDISYGIDDEYGEEGDLVSELSQKLKKEEPTCYQEVSHSWQKQGRNNFLVSQALGAMKIDRHISLKSKSQELIFAKQSMNALGWKFDPNKSKEEQIIGPAIY